MGKLDPQRAGNLEVRLALTPEEVTAAQVLRYAVFYDEMGARPTAAMAAAGRDFDDFDPFCDHLLVLDHNRGAGAAAVVGTYRLMRRQGAARVGGFYTAAEYDIRKIVAFPGEILELGRSCVDVGYRNRPTMQLLWRGITAYVVEHDVGVMFGCASLPGTDPTAVGHLLAYLYHNHLAPEDLRPTAVPERYTDMRLVAPEAVAARAAVSELPPLVKGYLRLGGFVGDGAVVDHQFNTTDVCVIVKTELVTGKYFKHFDRALRDGRGSVTSSSCTRL